MRGANRAGDDGASPTFMRRGGLRREDEIDRRQEPGGVREGDA
jgi:hypothetical protein